MDSANEAFALVSALKLKKLVEAQERLEEQQVMLIQLRLGL